MDAAALGGSGVDTGVDTATSVGSGEMCADTEYGDCYHLKH